MSTVIWIFVILAAVLLVITVFHQILKAYEQPIYPAPGKLVNVDGKKMHVFSKGAGAKTIVMMSGHGTPSPVLDFTPLTDKLSMKYKVVVVENFGYGWSDSTSKKRTVENIVEETRTALQESGHKPPYILLGHSISGIYTAYYANKYPAEVEAVVGDDTTFRGQHKYVNFFRMPYLIGILLSDMGTLRILTKLFYSAMYEPLAKNGYSVGDIKLIRLMACWHTFNRTVTNEFNLINRNIELYPNYNKQLPVLLFVSKKSNDARPDWKRSWLEWHEDMIKDLDKGKCIMLNGGHYLHLNCSEQMADEIEKFLKG